MTLKLTILLSIALVTVPYDSSGNASKMAPNPEYHWRIGPFFIVKYRTWSPSADLQLVFDSMKQRYYKKGLEQKSAEKWKLTKSRLI